MKQFEYQTIENSTILKDEFLNKLGSRGWELVSFSYINIFYTYIFKREINHQILGTHGAN